MKYTKKMIDPFTANLPTLDLHGYHFDEAKFRARLFVEENFWSGRKKIVIIHGIGKGILKEAVHYVLRTDNYVKDYKLDNNNNGMTIANLK